MKTTIRAAAAALFIVLVQTSFATVAANDDGIITPLCMQPEEIRPAGIPPEFELSLDVTARSLYIGEENGSIFYDGPVFQTDIRLTHQSGLYLGIWVSSGFDTEWPSDDWSDEVDYYVGFAKEIAGFEFDASVFWCDDTPVGRSVLNDVLIASLYVSAPAVFENDVFSVKPGAFVSGYWTFGETEFEGGVIGGIGLDASLTLLEKLTIDAGTYIIYDDGAYGNGIGSLFRGTLAATVALSDSVNLKLLELTVFTPLSVVDERKTECVLGIGLAVTF